MRFPLALALATLLHAGAAPAHGRDPEVVTLEEARDATVTVSVRVDDDPSRVGAAWSFALSARCRVLDAPARAPEVRGERWRWRVDCGPSGLDGVTVDSLGSAHETLVNVRRRDGSSLARTLRPSAPAMVVPDALSAPAPWWITARGFVSLGVSHLATGLDHLLFLALLLVRVRSWRRRAVAVSSFTAGHALTLCVAALTTVPVSAALVEALIAGSIWLLAADTWRSLSEGDGVPDRVNIWALPAAFGLVHGLGFAGALRAAGMRSGERVLALASFNLGIELAQLAAVLSAATLGRLAAGRWASGARVVTALSGVAGGWWLTERVVALCQG
ncbi:MAG: hypothetical protein EPO40_34730 [Myxococcaceae bacterium]|nr:MAG: hypothetical protein EPO40_34730 [Myxococcaceae bacterium]